MAAKSDLLERLRYIDSAIALPALIDTGIIPDEHNNVANLLRKGLCIVSFNILEDFIKKKAVESLNNISNTNISYSNLTDQLQESAIIGALASLNFQSKILKKENQDYKAIIQEETRKISSTNSNPFELSKYSLLSSGSNITSSEIKDFLSSFGISNGWKLLKTISDSIGGGVPDLSQAFSIASQRRNSAAHSATFNYDYTWIANLKSEILAISSSIDIAITARCRQAKRKPRIRLETHNLTQDLNYRFIEDAGLFYRETKSIGGKSIKNWINLEDAINHHINKIENKKEFIIVLNQNRRIMDWYT